MIKFTTLIKPKFTIFLICLILFILPFFWLRPGEMDLGGDSNRLYFYDPLSNLKAFATYSVAPWGTGIVVYNQYFIPYLIFLSILKFIFGTPTVLIDIFNGFKLSGSFIFVFLIVKNLFHKQDKKTFFLNDWCGAIIAGLLYAFSPAVIENMKYSLVTHDLVFLNPALFYLLLLSIIKSSPKTIWLVLLISIFFSSSFSIYGPPIFAFWPLAILFLILYNFFILKKSIFWKGIIIFLLFFLGLHALHLFPVASNVFDKGSEFNSRVFEASSKVNSGLEYFSAIAPSGKVSKNILFPLEDKEISWSLIIFPLLMIFGLLSLKQKDKTLLLTYIFFLITLFLASANISHIGLELYKKLFLIPGFGMFRNFYGQWQFVYAFFYSIFLGLTISILFSRVKKRYVYIISFFAISLLLLRSSIVFNGKIIDAIDRTSKGMRVIIKIDPKYEKLLNYLKKIPNDGRILHMPFTDFAYNIVAGTNNGVYIGQSMTSFLAGRNDFAGYQNIDPFSDVFVKIARQRNYGLIKQMMALLQIRYVLYNSDPKVSSKYFPSFPYGYTGVPWSTSELETFVHNISGKKVYQSGTYSLFEVDKNEYLPHFYTASHVFLYNINPKYDAQYSGAISFFPSKTIDIKDPRIVFLDRRTCKKILSPDTCAKDDVNLNNQGVQITFQKINPTKYSLVVDYKNSPFLLVFQNEFSPYWKLYRAKFLSNKKIISDTYFDRKIIELNPFDGFFDPHPFETNYLKSEFGDTHVQVNGYANAWYIDPHGKSGQLKIIIEMSRQKTFYYFLIISIFSFVIFIFFGFYLLLLKKHK